MEKLSCSFDDILIIRQEISGPDSTLIFNVICHNVLLIFISSKQFSKIFVYHCNLANTSLKTNRDPRLYIYKDCTKVSMHPFLS